MGFSWRVNTQTALCSGARETEEFVLIDLFAKRHFFFLWFLLRASEPEHGERQPIACAIRCVSQLKLRILKL